MATAKGQTPLCLENKKNSYKLIKGKQVMKEGGNKKPESGASVNLETWNLFLKELNASVDRKALTV